jgi:DNA-3-methyladenine glycosylase II
MRHRRGHVEPQGIGFARGQAGAAFCRRERIRMSRIERRAVRVVRPLAALREHSRDLAAAFEARIEHAQPVEFRQRGAISVEMRALAPHRLLPAQAKPRQILADGVFILRTATRGVDIFQAQQEAAAGGARHVKIEERGERMAEVQIAVWTGAKRNTGSDMAEASCFSVAHPTRPPITALHAFRFLHNETDLDAALAILTAGDVRLARLIEVAGRPALRRRPAGFPGLCAIICSQQLSTASAAAIWGRLAASFAPFHHDAIRQARAARLARLGLSRPKIKTLKAISAAIARVRSISRRLPAWKLTKPMPRSPHCMASVHGPPTSISCSVWVMRMPGPPATSPCRRPRLAFGLKRRPTGRDMVKLAEEWRPWRGVAAHMLWNCYRAIKRRDPVPAQHK